MTHNKLTKTWQNPLYMFHEINMLPVPIDIDKIAGHADLSYSLFQHSAKFHKTCKLKFDNEKLEKSKRKCEKSGQELLQKYCLDIPQKNKAFTYRFWQGKL